MQSVENEAIRKEFILENKYIRASVMVGNKGMSLVSFYDKTASREWIYVNSRKGRPVSPVQSYDSQYFGGAEFLFPNDFPMKSGRWKFPDHGYLWRTEYGTEGIRHTGEWIKLTVKGMIAEWDIEVEIEFSLQDSGRELHVQCRLSNRSEIRFPYLFRFHPSFAVKQTDSLKLYGKQIKFEMPEGNVRFSSFNTTDEIQEYPWLQADDCLIDIEKITRTDIRELFCHIRQERGGFEIREEDGGLRVIYTKELFPYLTVYYFKQNESGIAILEPSTSDEADLEKEIKSHKERILTPHGEVCYNLILSVD